MPTDTPHIYAEQADLYAAAGLTAAERAAVDDHITHCPTCAAMIANVTTADASLRSLLSAVRPSAAMEDAIVGRLRAAQRMRLSPPARRAAVVAAAAVGVIGAGWIESAYLAGDRRLKREAVVGSDVFSSPSLKSEKWDFGGGSNTAINWANWNGDRGGADKDAIQFAVTSGLQKNPFVGTQHDNFFRSHRSDHSWPASRSPAGPAEGADSFLRPVSDGDKDEKQAVPSPLAASATTGLQAAQESSAHDELAKGMADRLDRAGAGSRAGGKEKSTAYFYLQAALKDQVVANNPTSLKHFDVGFDYAGQVRAAAGPVGETRDRLADRGGPVVTPNDTGALAAHALAAPVPAAAPSTQIAVDTRKVIRTGAMAFDVDRFDAAADTLAKVVGEAGGFVATVDSQKLPNGKTQGTVTVRCPPERLDLLVLSLRSLGDLKSQQIVAQDVTKEYTDLEGELTADRAMADRMLDLIRTGKGAIKDLLAAEKELGTWRQKIEHIEGQLRYFNSQIGLSTLAVTLSERDLRQAAATVETETADMGVEADDVEKARDGAIKTIDDAKGRIVEAELKRLDAGQLAARIVADVPPEMAGATIDRLKQLGRVARLEVHRQQTAVDSGTTSPTTPIRTERRPTRLVLSIYNLANVAPRRTTAINLAADDPEAAYTALLALARHGGRVVTSNLDRGTNGTGTVSLEVPPAQLDGVLSAVRALGEVLKRTVTENADTQNATDAKVGCVVSITSVAAMMPREVVQQTLAATDVPAAYRAVTAAAAAAHGRVRVAQVIENDPQNVTATVEVDVPRPAAADFARAIAGAGDTAARQSTTSADTENTVDGVVRVRVAFVAADRMAARETTTLAVEVTDADKAAADAQAVAVAAGGRVLSADVSRSPAGPATAKVVLDVPLARAADVVRDLRRLGTVRGVDAGRDANAPAGPLAHAHVELTLATADALVADSSGPWANVRHGLSVGLTGLLWSLQLIVVGLCLLVPWAVVGYAARRVWRRWYRPVEPRA